MRPTREPLDKRLRGPLRLLLAIAMCGVGALHFVTPTPFVRIVPSFLPMPLALVYVSGVFEILGGLGLLVPRARRAASIGLVALYVAVFPANVNMAVNHISLDGASQVTMGPQAAPHPGAAEPRQISPLALWLRLPFQALFIAWAIWVGKSDEQRP